MKNIWLRILFCCFCLIGISACVNSDDERYCRADKTKPTVVSMYALLANPQNYSGCFIGIDGVLNMEFEGNALFADKEAFAYYRTIDSIHLSMDVFSKQGAIRENNGKWVRIEGVFIYYRPSYCPVGDEVLCIEIGLPRTGRFKSISKFGVLEEWRR